MKRRQRVKLCVSIMCLAIMMASCGKQPSHDVPQAVAQPEPLEQVKQAPPPAPAHIAFLLPMNGPYAVFGQRILDGAKAAQSHLADAGVRITFTVVDTSDKVWATDFQALPQDVRIIGGPLRPEVLAETLSSPGRYGRRIIAFMSDLPEAVAPEGGAAVRPIKEGRDVWRFFTSPEDNVRTLLAAARELDAHNLGVLFPDEPFGYRRSALFRRMAKEQGFPVAAARYAPGDPESWGLSTARLLEAGMDNGGPVDAIYIPDVWSQARALIPNLLVQQNRQSLILGSALWAQTMDVRNKDEALLFRTSVYPGAWWGEREASQTQSLRRAVTASENREPGYWEALGFDFVRLVSRLGTIAPYGEPEETTAALQRASAMEWAMAPVLWDADGRATQELYLFTPALYGPIRADLDDLRKSLHGDSLSLPAQEAETPAE